MITSHAKIAAALLRYRKVLTKGGEEFWPFLDPLGGRPADKRTANKFLLACIVDYQQSATRAWAQAKWFVETELKDPPDIWRAILKRHKTANDWLRAKARYGLHRWPKAHGRVYRIGAELIKRYDGDARTIWKSGTVKDVLERFSELRMGRAISNMIVGALKDTGQLRQSAELKADIHVCRVLGRITTGSALSPDRAEQLARKINPTAPWLLDRPLFVLGTKNGSATNSAAGCCRTRAPQCERCFPAIRNVCALYHARGADAGS